MKPRSTPLAAGVVSELERMAAQIAATLGSLDVGENVEDYAVRIARASALALADQLDVLARTLRRAA